MKPVGTTKMRTKDDLLTAMELFKTVIDVAEKYKTSAFEVLADNVDSATFKDICLNTTEHKNKFTKNPESLASIVASIIAMDIAILAFERQLNITIERFSEGNCK